MKSLIRNILVFATLAVLVLNIYIELIPDMQVDAPLKICFAFVLLILFSAGTFYGRSRADKNKRLRSYVLCLFCYYIWVLLNVLFFDNAFRRGFSPGFTFHAVNLVPLKTIRDYLRAYRFGNISLELVILNLIGNTVAFAPMGALLPALFRWQRSIFFFTATMTLSIVSVELIQVYTGVGSCDIDDLILNLGGALVAYLVCRFPPIWRRICRITPKKGDSSYV